MPNEFPPTKIYLDTSVIVAADFLRSPSAQSFLEACSLLRVTVYIPDVVRDEVIFKFRPEIKKRLDSYRKAERTLQRIVQFPSHEPISFDQEVSEFEGWFKGLTKEHKIQILPYPEISLKALVRDSYKRCKPFKATGEGYKDYLIWHSIQADLRNTPKKTKVYFLTSNTSDFCEQREGTHVLHPDLAADLKEGQKPPVIFKSIKSFFEEVLSPQLDDISLSEVPGLTRSDIEEYAERAIRKEFNGKKMHSLGEAPCLDPGMVISSVQSFMFDELFCFKKLNDKLAMYILGTTNLVVSGYFYDVYGDDMYADYISSNESDDPPYVNMTVEASVEVMLIYSLSKKDFTGHEVILSNSIEDDPY